MKKLASTIFFTLFVLLCVGCFGPSYQEQIDSILAQRRAGAISEQSAVAAIDAIRAEQEANRAYYIKEAHEAQERKARLELEKQQNVAKAPQNNEIRVGHEKDYKLGRSKSFFERNSPFSQISVKIFGGKVAFYGERREYVPIFFHIRDGETKPVRFAREGRRSEHVDILCSYTGGVLRFDIDAWQPYEMHYQAGWKNGFRYSGLRQMEGKNSKSEAQNITIEVATVKEGR